MEYAVRLLIVGFFPSHTLLFQTILNLKFELMMSEVDIYCKMSFDKIFFQIRCELLPAQAFNLVNFNFLPSNIGLHV